MADATIPMTPMTPQAALDELARIALADHSMETVMSTVAELVKRTVPGAHEVSMTLLDKGVPCTVAFTGPLARDLDERQYERGYGPCLDSIAAGSPVHIPSMRIEQRWRGYVLEALSRGVGSMLCTPVPLQREVSAGFNVYGLEDDGFDAAGRELADTFAAYAGVALANMHLYETQGRVADQLRSAMESRAVIEQAKGILMGQRRCGAQEAFDLLVRLSQESNRKLREVAQALVDDAAQPA